LPQYFLGLDIGQRKDYTALVLLESALWIPSGLEDYDLEDPYTWSHAARYAKTGTWRRPSSLASAAQVFLAAQYNYAEGRPANPPLYISHIKRWPLNTRAQTIVDDTARLLDKEQLRGRSVATLVDVTGGGYWIAEQLWQAGVPTFQVWIHGGSHTTLDRKRPASYNVAKVDLVSAVRSVLDNNRLVVATGLPERTTLADELKNFRYKINLDTAHMSFAAWREQEHDDLVLAAAMAIWFREYYCRHLERAYARAGITERSKV
jgi:hypothetical protein